MFEQSNSDRYAGAAISAGLVFSSLALVAFSGGLAAPLIVAANITSAAAMGAGVSGGIYSATAKEFDKKEFGKEMVIGAATSVATTGVGAAVSKVGAVTKASASVGKLGTSAAGKVLGSKISEEGAKVVGDVAAKATEKAAKDFAGSVAGKATKHIASAAIKDDPEESQNLKANLSPAALLEAGLSGMIAGQISDAGNKVAEGMVASLDGDTMIAAGGRIGMHGVVGAGVGATSKMASNKLKGKRYNEDVGGAAVVGGLIGVGNGATREMMRQLNKPKQEPKNNDALQRRSRRGGGGATPNSNRNQNQNQNQNRNANSAPNGRSNQAQSGHPPASGSPEATHAPNPNQVPDQQNPAPAPISSAAEINDQLKKHLKTGIADAEAHLSDEGYSLDPSELSGVTERHTQIKEILKIAREAMKSGQQVDPELVRAAEQYENTLNGMAERLSHGPIHFTDEELIREFQNINEQNARRTQPFSGSSYGRYTTFDQPANNEDEPRFNNDEYEQRRAQRDECFNEIANKIENKVQYLYQVIYNLLEKAHHYTARP